MNALQDKPTSTTFEPPTAATRPFTRVHNVICDEIKPGMRKHKVDRCVLDAIIRLLEGFHRCFIVVTIGELAARAGVSQSSVSAALARLEANGLITRNRKLLSDRSRFVWCLALTDDYRVVAGMGTAPGTPTKFHTPFGPQPKVQQDSPQSSDAINAEQPELARPDAAAPGDLEAPFVATEAAAVRPELPVPPAKPLTEPPASPPPPPQSAEAPLPEPAAPSSASVSEPIQTGPVSAPSRIPADKPARPELTAEQKTSLEALQAVGIHYWMARKLARAHSHELIHQALLNLRHRAGTVRNPAAWIVREIERGGYTNPAAAQEERLKNDRAAREALERDREAQERARAEQASEALLARYRQLEPARQRELEQLARTELARVSPRLAEAPADVETPGPFRSKLLELLELAPDIKAPPAAGPTAQPPREPRRQPLDPASGILLERFRQLDPERQRELEQRTRAELRVISPRLAEEAWELEHPGPLRSQLLALLASLPGDSS